MILAKIILVFSLKANAIIFFEAETAEGYDMMKGAVLASTMLEEVASFEENEGISIAEIERALSQHNNDASSIIGKGRNIQTELNGLLSPSYIKNSKRKTADNIRKTTRLIKALCALGPDSCAAANSHLIYNEQRQTNEILLEQMKQQKIENIKAESDKLKNIEATVSTLNAIENIPNQIIESLHRNFK